MDKVFKGNFMAWRYYQKCIKMMQGEDVEKGFRDTTFVSIEDDKFYSVNRKGEIMK